MRTEFERRPVLLALAGLVVGLSAPVFQSNLLFGAAGLIFMRSLPARLALAVGFCAGAVLAPVLPPAVSSAAPIAGIYTVSSSPTPSSGGGAVFLADGPHARLEVTTPALVPVLGDEISIQGQVRPLPQEREHTYLARGVTGIVNGPLTLATVVKHATGVSAWGAAWRDSFLLYSRRRLSPSDGGVAAALAFDVRTGLKPEDRTALEQSGTVHVLAASGLHLLALAWMLELIASRLPIPLLVRRTSILSLLTVYAAAAGFHPGTFRALVGTALRDGALVLGREYDALSGVAAAGVLYLLWRPNMVGINIHSATAG